MRRYPVVLLLFGFSVGLIAQTTKPTCSPGAQASGEDVAILRTGTATSYSLTAVIRSERKLADGNVISGFLTSHQAQDASGRTRVEIPNFCAVGSDHQPLTDGTVLVTDPVAKARISWHEGVVAAQKIADVDDGFVMTASRPPTLEQEYHGALSQSQTSQQSGNGFQTIEVEKLGRRNIAGLDASGMRTTRTVAAGVEGNSMPLVFVDEVWISDQYGLVVRSAHDNPLFGKSTYEVTDFAAGEPDASAFRPPADYVVVHRTPR